MPSQAASRDAPSADFWSFWVETGILPAGVADYGFKEN